MYQHLNEYLELIKDKPEFIVIPKDGYTVIDYVYQTDATFDHPALLECRGIKFDSNGLVLARPFHKFFNVGEREQFHEIEWHRPHWIMEKLDGSMVHPAYLDGELVLMTRKGVTEVAQQAQSRFLTGPIGALYRNFMDQCIDMNMTPIFEYTAPDNRIVLHYDTPQLTLLAVRNRSNGQYMSIAHKGPFARQYSIPYAKQVKLGSTFDDSFYDEVKSWEGAEGVVIQFDNGHFLKVKTDEYVQYHRMLNDIGNKRKVLQAIFEDRDDDILPVLPEADQQRLREFKGQVNTEVVDYISNLKEIVKEARTHGVDRKTFALEYTPACPVNQFTGALFKFWEGNTDDGIGMIKDQIVRNPQLINAKWGEV